MKRLSLVGWLYLVRRSHEVLGDIGAFWGDLWGLLVGAALYSIGIPQGGKSMNVRDTILQNVRNNQATPRELPAVPAFRSAHRWTSRSGLSQL